MSLKPPHKLDEYHLQRKLGEGETGEVYLAKYSGQDRSQKEFAVKILAPEMARDETVVNLLIEEATVQAVLDHDNIVKVLELISITEPEPIFFIVMEYVDGHSLAFILEKLAAGNCTLPMPYKLYLVHEILKGLDFAHTRKDNYGSPLNIIHGKLSPDNILISREGRLKITGFGTTKAKRDQCSYISPAQVSGPIMGASADLFAVGCILFELLSGQRIFGGKNPSETLDLVRLAQNQESLLPEIDAELAAVVEKSLSQSKQGRFESAHEFGEAIWKYMFSKGYYITPRELAKEIKELSPGGTKELFGQNVEIEDNDPGRAETVVQEATLPETKTASAEEAIAASVLIKQKQSHKIWISVFILFLTGTVAVVWQKTSQKPIADSARLKNNFDSFIAEVEVSKVPKEINSGATLEKPAETQEYGVLAIVASPWAYVSVANVVRQAETPLIRRVKVGSYRVDLWYPKDGRTLSVGQGVEVKSSGTTRCFASFEKDSPGMACH